MYILNDRLYFLMRFTDECRGSTDAFKPLMVETEYGLLVTGSVSAVGVMEDYLLNSNDKRIINSSSNNTFFIFGNNKKDGKTVTLINGLPHTNYRSWSRTVVKEKYLKDVGLIGRFTDQEIERFIRMCFAEGISMEQAYTAVARSWFVAGSAAAFMKNAKGIPLEEFFNHPYALNKKSPSEI